MRQVKTRILFVMCVILGLSIVAADAFAQSRSLDEGPPIRRQLLHRSARFELGLGIGSQFGNAYTTPFNGNLTARYFLGDAVSLGVDINGSPFQLDRRFVRDIEENDPAVAAAYEIGKTPLIGSLQLTYSPMIGKVNIFGKTTTYFDAHIIAGFGVAMNTGDAKALQGMELAPVIGMGLRLFLTDSIALEFRLQDYIYQDVEAYRLGTSADKHWKNHVIGTVGVGFFFPRGVYISK